MSSSRKTVASVCTHPPRSLCRTLATSATVSLSFSLAYQAVHWPGLLQALLGAEPPILAASPAAQRFEAPLMPATHLRAPGAVTPQACRLVISSDMTDWALCCKAQELWCWCRESMELRVWLCGQVQQVAHSGLQHRPACPAMSTERAVSCSAAAFSGSEGAGIAGPLGKGALSLSNNLQT